MDPYADETMAFVRRQLQFKFFSYIAYLMIAIYIEKVYERKLFDSIGEAEFREDDYRKLFEFSADDNADRAVKPGVIPPGPHDGGGDEGGHTHEEELAAWRAGLNVTCEHRQDEQQEDNAFYR